MSAARVNGLPMSGIGRRPSYRASVARASDQTGTRPGQTVAAMERARGALASLRAGVDDFGGTDVFGEVDDGQHVVEWFAVE